MATKRRRDPYKNFNFLVFAGAAIGGIAVVAILRRLFARAETLYPGVYIEETPAGARPIEGVGTSTAAIAAHLTPGFRIQTTAKAVTGV